MLDAVSISNAVFTSVSGDEWFCLPIIVRVNSKKICKWFTFTVDWDSTHYNIKVNRYFEYDGVSIRECSVNGYLETETPIKDPRPLLVNYCKCIRPSYLKKEFVSTLKYFEQTGLFPLYHKILWSKEA